MQRRLDLRALQLSPFTPGMLLYSGQGLRRFADPTRSPGDQADLVHGRLAGPAGTGTPLTPRGTDSIVCYAHDEPGE